MPSVSLLAVLLLLASHCVDAFPNEATLGISEQIFRKIPITRCCPDGEFYSLATGTCKTEKFPYSWPPPVHSTRFNRTIVAENLRPFDLTERLETCSDGGNGVFVSLKFTFYEDGTLVLPGGTRLLAGEFCINPADVAPEDEKDGPLFLARYCALDPCNTTNCVKKCCPDGMAMNATANKCQPSSLRLVIDFKNESGVSVRPEPYVLRDGNAPLCTDGMYVLDPSLSEEDEFFILPDGRLYQPSAPETFQYNTVYCVENFFSDESTNLNALMCFPPQPSEDRATKVAITVFPYLLFLSSIFLIATFVIYAILPEIRNVHGVTIMCHVASLSVMYIGLGIIQSTNLPDGACVGLAIVVHFAFLSTFTWLNVMSFDIWWTFSRRRTSRRSALVARAFWMRTLGADDDDDCQLSATPEHDLSSDWDLRPRKARNGRLTKRFIFYSLYAWGVPLVIVATGQILEKKKTPDSHFVTPGFGTLKCWFSEDSAFFAYLYGPVAVLIMSNVVFFVMTASLLYRASVDAAFAANRAHAKQKLRVIFSLFILMGVSWMTEVISFAVGGVAYIWLLTDIFNILTGVFIFVIFVCKPNVWKLLKMKFPCFERLDPCCPRYMRRNGNRQETLRVTRNESLPTNKTTESGITSDDDSKRRSSFVTSATRTTQIHESSHIESGDEMQAFRDREDH